MSPATGNKGENAFDIESQSFRATTTTPAPQGGRVLRPKKATAFKRGKAKA